MAVPKGKVSPSRKGLRRSHHALGKTFVNEDQTSGEIKRPHHVSSDGFYRGRKVTEARVNK